MEMSEAESYETKSKKFPPLMTVAVLALLGIAAYAFMSNKPESSTTTPGSSVTITSSPAVNPASDAVVLPEGTASNVVEYEMKGTNFRFSPASLAAKKGDTVRVTLTSEDMPHDFVIDELSVSSEKVNKGETTTVEFVATQAGTFEFYCSVGNHKQMGMVGTLTVTE